MPLAINLLAVQQCLLGVCRNGCDERRTLWTKPFRREWEVTTARIRIKNLSSSAQAPKSKTAKVQWGSRMKSRGSTWCYPTGYHHCIMHSHCGCQLWAGLTLGTAQNTPGKGVAWTYPIDCGTKPLSIRAFFPWASRIELKMPMNIYCEALVKWYIH